MEYNNDKLNEMLVSRLGVLELENLQLRAVIERQKEVIEELKQKVVDDGLQNS